MTYKILEHDVRIFVYRPLRTWMCAEIAGRSFVCKQNLT